MENIILSNIVSSIPKDTDYLYRPLNSKLASYVDLIPKVFEVDDQGRTGSCTANATTSCLEYMLHSKNIGESLSRLFVYWTTRNLIENRPGQSGATMLDAVRSCKHYGVCVEKIWPYIECKADIKPDEKAFEFAKEKVITRYERIDLSRNRTSEEIIYSIKSALNEGLPVVFSMVIGNKFMNLSGPWRKHKYPRVNKTDNKSIGGHAMLIIGYSDSDRNFLIENSWGKRWGDGGFCGISYDTLVYDIMEGFVIREFNGITINTNNEIKITKEQAGGNIFNKFWLWIRDFFR